MPALAGNKKVEFHQLPKDYFRGGQQYGRKEQVPSSSSLLQLAERKNKNIIKNNINKVVFEQSDKAKEFQRQERLKVERDKLIDINKNFGKIPNYLLR